MQEAGELAGFPLQPAWPSGAAYSGHIRSREGRRPVTHTLTGLWRFEFIFYFVLFVFLSILSGILAGFVVLLVLRTTVVLSLSTCTVNL